MTTIQTYIEDFVRTHFLNQLGIDIPVDKIVVNETKEEFEGEFTLVVFPLVGLAKSNPQSLANQLGELFIEEGTIFSSFNVVKGFLNLTCQPSFWISELKDIENPQELIPQVKSKKIVLEYASPNSNKPLHLGHVRNILLGWSVGQLLQAIGHHIHYTQIVNNRGVAICKSMLAWKKYFDGATPESTSTKADHFVGEAYVRFNTEFEKEYSAWQTSEEGKARFLADKSADQAEVEFFKSYKNKYFNQESPLGQETREMLLDWESGEKDTLNLWEQMNAWFMTGFMQTTDALGIRFDNMYFESDTYLRGKDIVEEGLAKGLFYREKDGSIWVDLEDVGLDKKIILRKDGTSVYITQDLGTAKIRHEELAMDGMIYTVGNEQNYHFQVLFEVLKRLGEPFAEDLHHLSYGLVDLPSGRMKTREGTVVDADDLIAEVVQKVEDNNLQRGELDMLPSNQKADIIQTIALGALKYYLLRVEAKKRMLFNPEESVDLHGQTAPYIQNAYVRVQSIKRRLEIKPIADISEYELNKEEKDIVQTLMNFGKEVHAAALNHDPAILAAYSYKLARQFHRFYHDHSIAKAESESIMAFRYRLALMVADRLQRSMKLLGIDMPDRM